MRSQRGCPFQLQLIGNRLLDDCAFEEARVVAVCSMAALVGLIERIEKPHSQAFKVVHVTTD
jgi:hypothetical protein